jgi:uncharacterized protein (TIGR00725 family)
LSGQNAVAVFGSSQTDPGTKEWGDAENVGVALAGAGLAVITGGYGGTMEAVSKGASESDGHVIGVTAPPLFPGRHEANPYVEELIEAEGLANRIGIMMDRAAGTMALPGSIGTATELLIAWNVNHIARRNGGIRVPTVAIGEGWGAVAGALVSAIDAFPGDVHLVDTSDEGLEWILDQLNAL